MNSNWEAQKPDGHIKQRKVNGQTDLYLEELTMIQDLFKQQQAMVMQVQEMLSTVKVVQQTLNLLTVNIKEFHYVPEERVTFVDWYARYEPLFSEDGKELDDTAKVRLLLRKLGMAEYQKYCSYIMPKTPEDFNFESTVKTMKLLFGPQESMFSKRFKCLRLRKSLSEDYTTFACRVNKATVEAKFSEMTGEEFKCFIFVCGLKDEKDSDIRMRLLSMIEKQKDVTLEQLMEECKKIMNFRQYTALAEGK